MSMRRHWDIVDDARAHGNPCDSTALAYILGFILGRKAIGMCAGQIGEPLCGVAAHGERRQVE